MKMRKRKHLRYTRRALISSWFVTWDKEDGTYDGFVFW